MSESRDSTLQAVRVGVIGVGNMGGAHARRLQAGEVPGAELAALCDVNPGRLEPFPGIPGAGSLEEMRARAALDAVLIATPHYDHVPLGIAALRAGLHVLVEKPIGVHKADALRLAATPLAPGQVFAAMFNQRTDPRYRWLRAQLSGGAFGRVHRVAWIITDWFRTQYYYDHGDWRATWAGEGGGVLLNQCPHQLDLWQWLFGMPRTVTAVCRRGRFHDIEVEDEVTAFLDHPGGPSGVFVTTTGEAPGTNRLEIAADGGRIVVEGMTLRVDRNEVPASEYSRSSRELFGRPDTIEETVSFRNAGEQHLGILKNFVAAIREGTPLIAPAAGGVASVELANAMILSGHTGRPVSLPLDAERYEAVLRELIGESAARRTGSKGGER